jgi:L-alanine-DL-glutamate epimerase-like enolase superfamily enzyme
VSYRVYEEFDPILVEARDDEGRTAWGEGHISPGYSDETVAGGLEFCKTLAAAMVGRTTAAAKALAQQRKHESPVAASALIAAVEALEGNPLLTLAEDVSLPLLTPFNAV